MATSFRLRQGDRAAFLEIDGSLDATCMREYYQLLCAIEDLAAEGSAPISLFEWDLSRVPAIDLCGTGMLMMALTVARKLPVEFGGVSPAVERRLAECPWIHAPTTR